ncbi:ribosome recycling factor [Halothermothrix orenii]|uniref:Ribosome-recycling factor n=1 Tax=Halothermothrix orenii (strain H 168 / OCM 544 / DSM 9562) TaxID=373903 RepID=RRF_HALOH|nr:ribosome recycling factor [Halothermothrix orenii]B8CW56.1 RecName: Full=Ribosome-recycling factor; Short=RRF; AltName: Full=Ribosome-releasing factor [Halothermothrix orenii H 168]ACL69525.1 ribosome recycling factor [Halothermothrix orenii H 168]
MIKQVEKNAKQKMEKVLEATKHDLNTVRTGRARPSLVENIMVDYYGTQTPIQQMAKVVAPEARQLVIEPWDKSVIESIEKAILKSNLGLNPSNDGNVIRINIPQLTEERRKELVKVAHEKAEKGRIAIRNIRREANDELKEMEKNSEISEDNYHRGLDMIQELTDTYIDKIDKMLEDKEQDIMEV